MTLVKNKSRVNTNMRRVKGDHHRKNDKYTKTYWPYLPIILILGGSLIVNDLLPVSINSGYATRAGAVFASRSSLLVGLLSVVLAILIVWYVVRHFKRLKSLIKGQEHVLASHYVLDVLAALVISGLYILVR